MCSYGVNTFSGVILLFTFILVVVEIVQGHPVIAVVYFSDLKFTSVFWC